MTLQIKKKRRGILLLSFLLPFLLSTLAFVLKGIAPFGDKSILKSDAWSQYHPYLSLFRDTLLRGGSLEHTWSIGMGVNFLPTIAYYLSSPMYLFSVLVPEALLGQFILLLTVVKLSLAGLFFACFLKYAYRSHDPMIPFFAVLYSLCAWSAGYYWCVIWLDVFALLPLLITGTLAMLREGRFRLYTLSLALSLWCNYYLTYCCCLFVLIAFVGYRLCNWTGWQNLLRSFLRFGLCTLLAVALAAALLLPALMGMRNTASANAADFSPFALVIPEEFYGFSFSAMLEALSQVSSRTLTNTPPTDLKGLPNLFTGFSALIFAFSFLWNKSFSRKDRLFHGLLLLFFVVSSIFKITDYVWHGFHFPNMLPARFTFLFSFTVLSMAFRGYSQIRLLGIPRALCSVGCGVVVLLLGLLNRQEISLGHYTLALNLLVLIGSVAIMILQTTHKKVRLDLRIGVRLSAILLILIFSGEAFLSFYSGVRPGLDEDRVRNLAISGQQLYETVAAEDPELFYRAEFSHGSTSNDGALHHYNGVDAFSSAALVNHGNLASALGLRAWPESNSTTYVESAPFTNTLCGIKYLLSQEDTYLSPHTDPLLETLNGYEIHALPSYIGMGFMTDGKLGQFASKEANKNPFAEQSELFRLATGLEGDLYRVYYEPELIASEGCSLEYTENESQFLYTVPDHMDRGDFTLRYTMEESGLLCVATRMLGGKNVDIFRNGELLLNTGVSVRGILSLGYVEEGDVLELAYTSDQFKQAGINTYMAIQNDDLLQQGLDILSDEVWNITYADDTTLTGTITALSDGLFYSSVPYEPGWTVTVDGTEIPIAQGYDPKNPDVMLTDAQICFPLTAGEHEITMTFRAPGLRGGLILSVVALCLFLVLCRKEALLPDLIPTVKENPND